MTEAKIKDLSFEVKPEWRAYHIPEVDDVSVIIDKSIESYLILKKAGKHQEALEMRDKIRETKYAKVHLKLVMNLDFDKPTPKLVTLAK